MANGPTDGTLVDTGSGLKYYPPVDTRPEAEPAGSTRVRVATAAALPANTRTGNVLEADAAAALNDTGVDGKTDLVEDDLILAKDEATGANNGVYKLIRGGSASVTWKMERASGWDSSAEVVAGRLVSVAEGTANGDKLFHLTADDPITLNTTALTFARTAITAADVPLVDAGGNLTAAELESAWAELFTRIAATDATALSALMKIRDVGAKITATDIDGALTENRTAIDAVEAILATMNAGVPMVNRLTMLGAPGAIVAGDTVTIGADVYEFRGDTPPSGGTADRCWVYNGADSAASRVNFINAVNGVVDAATITRNGTFANDESVLAAAGTTLGDVDIHSAAAAGGAIAASGTATATTEGLTTITDIWDQATMYGGSAAGEVEMAMCTVTLSAAHITKGELEITFAFTPTRVIVSNRMRQQDEAYALAGDVLTLTLAGGGAPNNQAADVIDVIALG